VAEVELEFAVFTREAFGFRRIAGEAGRLRRLGMSLRAIGSALEVDEKTVRKALRYALHAERQGTASGRHASCTAGEWASRPQDPRRPPSPSTKIVASVELLERRPGAGSDR
jgi:hypothetical protein